MRVLFACDGGAAVGGGHVMRCLTLAAALDAAGAQCAFLDSRAIAPVLDAFAPREVARVTAAADWPSDWVVLDSYRSTPQDEAGWRAGSRLAVVDDLGRPHAADMVIDPSFGREPVAYAPARALCGPQFALVRQAFVQRRDEALARRGGPVRRALVAFGLTDVGGVTAQALEAILPLAGPVALDVVVGAGAPSLERLRALEVQGAICLHVNARDMAGLCAKADIAIGAGGSSVWERAAVGLPSIVLSLAENQAPMTQALDQAGLLVQSTLETLGQAWARLTSNADLRQSLTSRSAALCDGLGAERCARALMG